MPITTEEAHVKFIKSMQEKHLPTAVRNGVFKFTNTFFPYTSGQIGPYYANSENMERNGVDYSAAIDDMAKMVAMTAGRKPLEVISGGEARDWVFSRPVAKELKAAHFSIFKEGKTFGADVKGKQVYHVADLNNEGSSPKNIWVPAIRGAGGKVEDIFFFIDRLEDGVQVMKEIGLQSCALIPLDEYAWGILQNITGSGVTPEVYKGLCARMEDKDAWAEAMLRSDEGLDTLAALLGTEKTREKGQKILATYDKIREEIVDRLKSKHGKGIERWL